MKQEFEDYMSDINISGVTRERVGNICVEIASLYNLLTISDIFVCDINNNTSREYTSLWLFSPPFIMECKNFMNEDDFDLVVFEKNVTYFNIKKNNYKVSEPVRAESSVLIDSMIDNGKITCNLMATGKNCEYAISIAKKYLISNIVVG